MILFKCVVQVKKWLFDEVNRVCLILRLNSISLRIISLGGLLPIVGTRSPSSLVPPIQDVR